MDYKVQVKQNEVYDVIIRCEDSRLIATILTSTNFKHAILDKTEEQPWAVLFSNVSTPTGVLWVTVEGSLVTINGQTGKRIDPEAPVIMKVKLTDFLLRDLEGYDEVRSI